MTDKLSDIEIYDTALYGYLKVNYPLVYYSPTDRAKEKNSRAHGDSTKYPFISFYRDPDLSIDESRANNAGIVQGDLTLRSTEVSSEDGKFPFEYVHSIPVNLFYQVDIWAARQAELLLLSQEVLIDIRSARRIIEVPINPNGEMARFCFDDVTLTDNSDLESENETGKVYRHTISFTIQAYIKNVRRPRLERFNPDIPVDIYD